MQAQQKVEYQLRSQRDRAVARFDDPTKAAIYLMNMDSKHGANAPKLKLVKITTIEEEISHD